MEKVFARLYTTKTRKLYYFILHNPKGSNVNNSSIVSPCIKIKLCKLKSLVKITLFATSLNSMHFILQIIFRFMNNF